MKTGNILPLSSASVPIVTTSLTIICPIPCSNAFINCLFVVTVTLSYAPDKTEIEEDKTCWFANAGDS